MVMLVRGKAPASFAGGLQRSKQVHLVPLGSTVLAECALHLQESITKVKAGPQPARIKIHPVNANTQTPPAELAHRMYALMLAPLCKAVVLAEGEFEEFGGPGGLEAIIRLLVSWMRTILACGATPRYRPQIVVFRRSWACLPRDLENRMTAEVLATCNFTRELTSRAAEAMWRRCFSGVVGIPVGLEDELGVCEQAIAASSESDGPACPALPSRRLPMLLHSACAHWPLNYSRPFNIIRASRLFPVPEDLQRQLEVVFRHATTTPALVSPASHISASALVKDTAHANLLGEWHPA